MVIPKWGFHLEASQRVLISSAPTPNEVTKPYSINYPIALIILEQYAWWYITALLSKDQLPKCWWWAHQPGLQKKRETAKRSSSLALCNYQQSLNLGWLTKYYLSHESAFFQPHSGKNPECTLTVPQCLNPKTKGQRGCLVAEERSGVKL